MHKDQTHIKRNCFSIGIISSKLQSGCYNDRSVCSRTRPGPASAGPGILEAQDKTYKGGPL
jgi:hypothetical protein